MRLSLLELAGQQTSLTQREALKDRPITDIALSWGFNNLSHFSRVFREHTGLSPSEFRSQSTAASHRRLPPH